MYVSKKKTWLFLQGLCVAVAYFVTARLSLFFVVSEGFASPIWPSSGIALAGVLLWGWPAAFGVFFGSFFVEAAIFHDLGTVLFDLPNMALFFVMAWGPVFQAVCVAFVLKKFLVFPNRFENIRDISLFFFVAGPVGSLISATLSVFILNAIGTVEHMDVFRQWFTWWAGDTMGVVVITPLIVLIASPVDVVSSLRKKTVLAPMLVIFLLLLGVFFTAKSIEERAVQRNFESEALLQADIFQDYMKGLLSALHSIEGLYASSYHISQGEFKTFTQYVLNQYPEVKVVEWAPKVARSDKKDFEYNARHDGLKDFKIHEWGALPAKDPEETRPYFPVYFIAPLKGNEHLMGLDLCSFEAGYNVIKGAIEMENSYASAPLDLEGLERSVMIVDPVYRAVASGREHYGFIVAILDVHLLASSLITDEIKQKMNLSIYDAENMDTENVLYTSGRSNAETMRHTVPFHIAQREWVLDFRALPGYYKKHSPWPIWMAMIGAMLFVSLLQFLLLIVTGQTSATERVVQSRTRELERSNSELERFAYVASHDLKAPLRHISICTEFIMQDGQDSLNAESQEYLDVIKSGTKRMMTMIDSLLDYARIAGKTLNTDQKVDFNIVLENVKMDLDVSIKEKKAKITADDLPVIYGDESLLSRLLLNLLQNAMKYCAAETTPEIHVSAQAQDEGYVFSVTDNGIGIPAEFSERIFEIFQRLHKDNEYSGTGIGLPACKRIIEYHKGRIWLDTQKRDGSQFCFYLPQNEKH